MRKAVIWALVIISGFLIITLHFHGAWGRGYPSIGGEALIPVIPLIGAAIISEKKKWAVQLPKGSAVYLAKTNNEWVQATGAILSEEDEKEFARRHREESGYLEHFCSLLKWRLLRKTPQECIKRASNKGKPVYIVSPRGLSKCIGNTFAFNLRPLEDDDSVFFMKAKGLSNCEGEGWGGFKVAFKLTGGGVISQEEALAHFGKQKLLEILGYGSYADDIEFISEEEYMQDYAHDI